MKADDTSLYHVPRVLKFICVPCFLWVCRLFSPEEKCILVEIDLQSQGARGFEQTDEWLAGLLSCDVELVGYLIGRLKGMGFVREEASPGDGKGRVLFLTHGMAGLRSAIAHYREQLIQSKTKELGAHLPKGQVVMREVAKEAANSALEQGLKTHQDHVDEARQRLWGQMSDRERRITDAIRKSGERKG
ncbi:MAG: hypothetical protein ACREKR_12565 [Candidatus Methylomirabilales bacterium]